MMIEKFVAWLADTPVSLAIGDHAWITPTVQTVHILAIAIVLVVGVVFVMDLRLIGITAGGQGLQGLLKEAVPFVWAAFGIAAITGFLLFSSSATTYAVNPAFRLKLVAMGAAGLNMALFHRVSLQGAEDWNALTRPPVQARLAGIISIVCWVVVVASGRWIGFLA